MDFCIRQGFTKETFLMSKEFSPLKLKVELQKLFVSVQGLRGHPTRYLLLRTPKVFRQQMIYGLVANLKTQRTKLQKRNYLKLKYPHARSLKRPWRFVPCFKTRRDWKNDSIYVETSAIKMFTDMKSFSLYHSVDPRQNLTEGKLTDAARPKLLRRSLERQRVFSRILLKNSCFQPGDFGQDCRLVFNKGLVHLMVTKSMSISDVNQRKREEKPDAFCALDPGVRKFLTGYSPQGQAFVIGENTQAVLNKCIRRNDRTKRDYNNKKNSFLRIKPVMSSSEKRKQRKMLYKTKKTYHASEKKAGNVVRDLHYKAANFLCKSYDTILYPSFNAHAIVKGGVLNKHTKRQLNMLSFFKFRCRLRETASFYEGVKIVTGSEAYTSKQCGRCGSLHETLSGSEVFKCPKCELDCDRDVHAARNILLRHLKSK